MTFVQKGMSLEEWVEQEMRDNEAKGFGVTEEEEEEMVSIPHEDARSHWGEVVARVPYDHLRSMRRISTGFFLFMTPIGMILAVAMVFGSASTKEDVVVYFMAGLVLIGTFGTSAWLLYYTFRLGNVSVYQKGLLLEPVLGRRRFRGWGHFMAYRVKGNGKVEAVSIRSKTGKDMDIHVMLSQYPDVVKILAHEVKERF